eukprot:g5559.t1
MRAFSAPLVIACAFSAAAAVDVQYFFGEATFEATPAVLGTMCADELDCAYEGATLCAFDVGGDAAAADSGTGKTKASFDFLECFDKAGSEPLFYDPTVVQACAAQLKLDYGAISKCANGTMSAALLKTAQKTVTAACGKEANLPTVHVQGKKAFGSGDFQKVFADFGSGGAAAVALVPAVRDPTGACVDEKDCAFERATVCAFDGQPVATQAAFLDCLDTPWSDLVTKKKVNECVASTAGVQKAAFEACVGGTRGDTLLQQASAAWTKAFPQPINLPQAQVDGQTVDASYDAIKKAACKAGSSSSVC